MALSAGTRFGVYEIVALIGQGGMARLTGRATRNRVVALKVLPDLFAAADRIARFTCNGRLAIVADGRFGNWTPAITAP